MKSWKIEYFLKRLMIKLSWLWHTSVLTLSQIKNPRLEPLSLQMETPFDRTKAKGTNTRSPHRSSKSSIQVLMRADEELLMKSTSHGAAASIIRSQEKCRLVPQRLSASVRRTGSVRGSLLERRGMWREFLFLYITFYQTAYKVCFSLQTLKVSCIRLSF